MIRPLLLLLLCSIGVWSQQIKFTLETNQVINFTSPYFRSVTMVCCFFERKESGGIELVKEIFLDSKPRDQSGGENSN